MKLNRLFILAAAILSPTLAFGQATLLQGGPFPAGHAPMYVGQSTTQPIVQDSGPAAGGPIGLGFSELLLAARGTGNAPHVAQGSGPLGTNFCDYDGPKNNPTGYHYLCLSANAGTGGALLTYGAGGGAAQLPFNAIINGITYPFPFASGGIVGPSTTVVGDLPTWANTAGTLLGDSGVPISAVHQAGNYTSVLPVTAAGNVTAPVIPTAIMLAKTVPAITTVTLPAASTWPNCPAQPGACPYYRVKDFGHNSTSFPITVVAADGAQFVFNVASSSFRIDADGSEFGFTLAGTAWSVD